MSAFLFQLQQLEQAQLQHREANLTALAAIGPRKKRPQDSAGTQVSTGCLCVCVCLVGFFLSVTCFFGIRNEEPFETGWGGGDVQDC